MSTSAAQEGDCFAVPLRDGGYAAGVVARSNPEGVLVGYFFGPARRAVPVQSDLVGLRAADALLVGRFGHLGLAQGTWPMIGQLPNWDRSQWAMPAFIRYEELSGRTFQVFYDDDDPSRVLREIRVPSGPAEQGPKGGLMGAGFVEGVLTRMAGSVTK
ncbi:Imm26 family immunity protein [Allobranchiibius sp. CTAmp26]|uniref:Imm26 family immunity protein n=1 Tax=Allobranchiibius sp. CTAmp26 TaxID=2815214 RepID=UPI001AA0F976|nr:Imm26 family immunity protein [Allobranchiibius sp. CTAmp26]MBO1756885.1 hypothetical protein [Allobranchiibius sp. CTAmp26]